MNHIATIAPADTLPMLIDRATAALESARSSGEVLEARDMARMAYDAAKSAARIMRAKEAHDSLIADVHRSQAHALAIRARAEMRLAEEYDAAQERGEVGKRGDFGGVSSRGKDTPTAADLGLAHKDIHEFRAIRDAEREEPGVIQRTIDKIVERGEEPTRAALNREISRKPKPAMPREPLWVWGRVKDFDRDGILKIAPAKIATQMTAQMRHDMREQLPAVIAYLTELKEKV